MIFGFFLVLHLIVCIGLVLVVLLQSGKGGGLAGAFGGMGGAGQQLFGGRGAATFLSKATTVLGISFMTTSLILALLAGSQGGARSVLRDGPAPGTTPPPVSSQPLQIPGGGDVILPTLGEGQDPTASEGTAPVTLDDIQPAEGTSPDEDGGGN